MLFSERGELCKAWRFDLLSAPVADPITFDSNCFHDSMCHENAFVRNSVDYGTGITLRDAV